MALDLGGGIWWQGAWQLCPDVCGELAHELLEHPQACRLGLPDWWDG